MLFAIHLNAAAASAEVVPSDSAGLASYSLGNVVVRFCESSAANELLLVLFAPAALGNEASAFLAAELLRNFEERFGVELHQQSHTTRQPIKRQAFAAGLHAATSAMPGFILERLLEQTRQLALPSSAPQAGASATVHAPCIEISSLAALHSATICTTLAASPTASSTASSTAATTAATTSDAASSGAKRRRRATGRTAAIEAHPPLLALLGLPDDQAKGTARSRRRQDGGGGESVGCFSCLRGSRTLPPPRPAALPLPLLYWRENGTAAKLSSPAAKSTAAASEANSQEAVTQQLQELVREMLCAWRHRVLTPANGLYSAPVIADDETAAASVTLVLLRSPILLRARATLRGDVSSAAAVEAQMPSALAAFAEAVHPWLAPLALSVKFVSEVGQAKAERAAKSTLLPG